MWVVVTHWLNVLFMIMMARSGIEILSAFPKFYWRDDCPPGREWLRLSKKVFSSEPRRPWSSLDEEESWNPVIALPGRKNLGLGRHWHFMTLQFWIATGAVYVAMVFATGYWHYLIPDHWSIIPDAIRQIGTYLHFELGQPIAGQPFNPAQKLMYFTVIFVVSPLMILAGAAMSPAVIGRFPWYGKLFGGKQGARSVHFLGMCFFGMFVVVHVLMVILHGLPSQLTRIVLGSGQKDTTLGLALGLTILFVIFAIQVPLSIVSLRRRRLVQHLTGLMVDPPQRVLSRSFSSRQQYTDADISPYHRVNGYPPTDPAYEEMARHEFRDYRLDVGGLVKHPVSLSVADLRALGTVAYIAKHNCIQGWTSIGKWGGIPVSTIIDLVEPEDEAKVAVFYAFDDKGLTEAEGRYGHFYGSIPLWLASKPQTILAVDMNGGPLPIEHGAPVRLRCESQLGFKMVKWVRAIEFVADYSHVGMGQGGWREDQQFYSNSAGI
ncbi:molybdopterin-dependent oxidoreductase [Speluncibacter jeojiensis]|uniref:Molybdopterin-dependent oxidoreductase n=1 Tax=Speluncibacter jeojiensis TaxID=2710754 RepID=A0A9X4MAD4_9ACTN|nr:molybdopterin-dependent oxidoreductase [Corynebacteriales bacterium D3-21]